MWAIRDLQKADLAVVAAINASGYPGVYPASVEKLEAITGMCCVALVAEWQGGVEAFCQVLPKGTSYESVNYAWFSARYSDFIYMDRIAVSEACRSRGVGALLYAEVERRTRARWLTAEVNLRPRNDGSLRFHERLGFKEVGQQETPQGTLVSLIAKELLPRSDLTAAR